MPRIRFHGAPPEPRAEREINIGDWQVYPARNRIVRKGDVRRIQPLSMNILAYLAARAGDVVGHEELLDAFWRGRIACSDAIHRRIADLRRHLGDDRRHPEYIETVPKRGYRLIADVSSAGGHPGNTDVLAAGSDAAMSVVVAPLEHLASDQVGVAAGAWQEAVALLARVIALGFVADESMADHTIRASVLRTRDDVRLRVTLEFEGTEVWSTQCFVAEDD